MSVIQMMFSWPPRCFSSRISRRIRFASVRSRKVPLIFLIATFLQQDKAEEDGEEGGAGQGRVGAMTMGKQLASLSA